MPPATMNDPWAQVEDIDGDGHYKILGILPRATRAEVKKAFRDLARMHHPDKGGDAETFSRVKEAFEVLYDDDRRRTYDTWAKELKFRYVRGVASQVHGGEDHLFDEFDRMGIDCDAATQLVVTCEVCGRPSTWECWTCQMPCCDFCGLKQHWRGKFPLHWPVRDNPGGMRLTLAKKELENKRLEDARRAMLEMPDHRSDGELNTIREFKRAVQDMLATPGREVLYDLRLARFYMWSQTARSVHVAVFVPTGYTDKELHVEVSPTSLKLQAEGSPPIIDRLFSGTVASDRPIEDNRVFAAEIPKARVGDNWRRLFRGDPDGARCTRPPYSMAESDDDVILEFELPFWVDAEDVGVQVTEEGVDIHVRSELSMQRTFWRSSESRSRRPAVEVPECLWSLDEEEDAAGERCKVLMVTLVKPPLDQEEIRWKRGARTDNRAAERAGEGGRRGYRFFADDEDGFGLEDTLQAMSFLSAGEAYVRSKPWEQKPDPGMIRNVGDLPKPVSQILSRMLELS